MSASPIRDALEPQAREVGPSAVEAAEVSMAISLKRIADSISSGSIDLSLIGSQIETIAWNAGRAFESGRRQ